MSGLTLCVCVCICNVNNDESTECYNFHRVESAVYTLARKILENSRLCFTVSNFYNGNNRKGILHTSHVRREPERERESRDL